MRRLLYFWRHLCTEVKGVCKYVVYRMAIHKLNWQFVKEQRRILKQFIKPIKEMTKAMQEMAEAFIETGKAMARVRARYLLKSPLVRRIRSRRPAKVHRTYNRYVTNIKDPRR